MIKDGLILGITGIFIGILILIKTGEIFWSLVPIIIGIFLIVFYKEENKIENTLEIILS